MATGRVPVTSDARLTLLAVKAEVPLPLSTPVKVVAPEPPFPTGKVPVIPVVRGNPVQLVRVPDVGVPSRGVTRVGDVAKTRDPLPVSFVTAVAKLAEVGVARNVATPVPKPDTPVEIGKPVQLVKVPDVGVPSKGVTRVGEVERTAEPVPVIVEKSV